MTGHSHPAKVAVFSLGGTIASTKDPQSASGGVAPRLGAGELVAAVPQLDHAAELEAIPFRQTASGDLGFDDISALAREITLRFKAGTSGAVVTQGTDSIEETSFALSLMVEGPRPVVVTGAMRNPTLAGADGPANLLAAVQVASSPAAEGLGTVVVLNDEIHAARYVRKTHTSSPSTFHSPNGGPLGWVVEGRCRIALRPVQNLPTITPPTGEIPQVALVRTALGEDSRMVEQIAHLGFAGLVVEGFGGGHVPARMVPALETLAGQIPVVLTSRTGSGEALKETYDFHGSERDLLGRGLIHGGSLDGLKARVLLTLLLADGASTSDVTEVFRSAAELG